MEKLGKKIKLIIEFGWVVIVDLGKVLIKVVFVKW